MKGKKTTKTYTCFGLQEIRTGDFLYDQNQELQLFKTKQKKKKKKKKKGKRKRRRKTKTCMCLRCNMGLSFATASLQILLFFLENDLSNLELSHPFL
jgi:hypothetical protein